MLNFCDCGSDCWVWRDGTQYALTCNKCHDRLCDPCQLERRQEVIEGILLRLIDCGDRARFVTLTLKHQDVPLAQQIDRLTSCFKLLRQHPVMGRYFQAGVWFLEVKLDKAGRLWHPHLHVIQVGRDRMPQLDLSIAWKQITGDSFMVWVVAITDKRQQAAYVTKYSTKPLHSDVLKVPAKLDEFVLAIKGRRLHQCFGTWSRKLDVGSVTPRKLERVGALCTVHADACRGDVSALVVMHQLQARWPRLRRSHPLPPHLASTPPPGTD